MFYSSHRPCARAHTRTHTALLFCCHSLCFESIISTEGNGGMKTNKREERGWWGERERELVEFSLLNVNQFSLFVAHGKDFHLTLLFCLLVSVCVYVCMHSFQSLCVWQWVSLFFSIRDSIRSLCNQTKPLKKVIPIKIRQIFNFLRFNEQPVLTGLILFFHPWPSDSMSVSLRGRLIVL